MTITNKNDVLILRTLYKNKKVSELQSMTITALTNSLENKFSTMKVRTTIYEFVKQGIVHEGLKQGNSKTYFISNDGIKILNDLVNGGKVNEL